MTKFLHLRVVLIVSLAFTVQIASAIISRVNNTFATDKMHNLFASLQEAHDAAAGTGSDTLLVEGSTKEYVSLNCTKKLVIIGTGYFLTQNTGQASGLSSVVETINFQPGSEGSEIIGLAFSSETSGYAPQIFASGIAIIRCYLTNGIFIDASITSMIVLQNYFPGNAISVESSAYAFSGVILNNNFITVLLITQSQSSPRIFASVDHNIFIQGVTISTASFRSNIIAGNYTATITSNAVQNNLTLGTQLASIPTNQSYQSAGALFVGLAAANNSPDGQYKILPASAFAKAGYNGEEPGIFGGTEPYVLSGIPPIPSIYELQADAVANKTNGLNVTIKARANQ